MKKVFLFDLDSTITKEEILPMIAAEIGKRDEMRFLTESTMMGEMPFYDSFKARVKILADVPVSRVMERVLDVRLNDKLVEFMNKNRENCFVVTSNLDVWIDGLMKKIGMKGRVFCSHASVKDDRIEEVERILKKEEPIEDFKDAYVVAVGDGSNDYDFLKMADCGIGFGGVRRIAPKLLDVCDYAVYTEDKLCELLEMIKEEHDQ